MGRTGFIIRCNAVDNNQITGETTHHVSYGILDPWSINELELESVPTQFMLHQNHPNPFNPGTRIRFEIPMTTHAVLNIYNIKGQQILQLCNQVLHPGFYTYDIDGSQLSSGTYFYRLIAGEFSELKKMVLVK